MGGQSKYRRPLGVCPPVGDGIRHTPSGIRFATSTADYSHNTNHIEPEEEDPTEPSEERSPDEIEDELRFLGLDDLLCKPVEPDGEPLDAPHVDDHIP